MLPVFAIAQRLLIELIRRKRSLIFWAVFPCILLLLNSYIIGSRAELSLASAVQFSAPPTLVCVALFFSCLGGTVSTIVSEREQQTLKRLLISPLTGWQYFLGIFIAHSCIGLAQTILLLILAFSLGATFKGSIFLGIIVILLSICSYVGLGFILGTKLAKRTEDVNAIISTFGIPLLILGGAFLPTFLFPKPLLKIAKFNPIYHINKAFSEVWAKGSGILEIQDHFLFILIFSLIMIIGGWLTYKQLLNRVYQD